MTRQGLFLGEHDWTAFASARIRTVRAKCEMYDVLISLDMGRPRANAALIEFEISANGFLRYMVRSIVGTLIEVGRGERDLETVKQAF